MSIGRVHFAWLGFRDLALCLIAIPAHAAVVGRPPVLRIIHIGPIQIRIWRKRER